eukprot:jgi/Tetstr1/443289/TSEL_000260.t1
MAAPDRIPRARALVHTKKGLRALNICLLFGADAIERDVAEVAGVPAASQREFPSEQAALQGSYTAPLTTFGDRLREQGQRPQCDNLQAAQYNFDDGDTLVFHVAAPPVQQLWDAINMVWPQDDRGVYYPSHDSEHAGVVVAPRWAVEHARGVFLANAPAVTNTADGGDEMSLDICRLGRYGRYGRLWTSGHKASRDPAPKTAPSAARVVKVPVPTRSTTPLRPPFDELELVAANVAHAKAAKDKAAAKKRHDIEDDEDTDDLDNDEDLGLASLVAACQAGV